jgi:UDP-N-acetyl-D-mannosaminuronic acid dehydrogenase
MLLVRSGVTTLAVVGGCGHVGLPLALAFAGHGVQVTIQDISEERVRQVAMGHMPFMEPGCADLLDYVLEEGLLHVTTDPQAISEAENIIVITGSGLSDVLPWLRNGQLVILRSTVRPGTLAEAEKEMAAAGLAVDLAFCPERIAEGHALTELAELPQLIGAHSQQAYQRAVSLFSLINGRIIGMTPEEAEYAKLFTNAWRYIQFAAANQFWMLATSAGLEYEDIRQAMMLSYPRLDTLPKAAFAAGPCLPKDTRLLNCPLGDAALAVNEGQPAFLADFIAKNYDLPAMTIGILGMTFKPGSDDVRNSLSYDLRDELLKNGALRVFCTDPYIASLPSLNEVREASDLLIIATAHPEYDGITGIRM